jgi:hypothetical protein
LVLAHKPNTFHSMFFYFQDVGDEWMGFVAKKNGNMWPMHSQLLATIWFFTTKVLPSTASVTSC